MLLTHDLLALAIYLNFYHSFSLIVFSALMLLFGHKDGDMTCEEVLPNLVIGI